MDLLNAAKASENDDIGAATGHRQAASDEVADSVKVGKVVKAIILLLKSDKGGSGTIQQSQVRSKVGASLRMHIASAVDLAVGDGRVIVVMKADASGRNGGDTAWLELGPNA